jgi:hypothetical protein
MSWIGATGQNENQEQFDILKDEIDANATYINTLVGIPDPLHTPIFGINILNPGLFGLVERAEVNIKALQLGEEGIGTNISGIETTISGIETTISGIEGEITALQGEVGLVQGEVSGLSGAFSTFNTITLPLIFTNIGIADGLAADALSKANKSLGIWDESVNNTYNKKSGNVGIGATFGGVLNNKLEVVGNINIPTGNTYRINDEPFNYSHLAGTPPVSSKWTNATDTITNIYYNTGNVGIGTTSLINNRLEVGGNLNISAGSKYKINNVDLSFSDLGGTLSYNSLTDKLTGGTNINIVGNAINNTYTYTLPTASTSILGGVKVDGTTININNGVISGANTYTLPTASQSVLGGVKVGSGLSITSGVLSANAGTIATTTTTGVVKVGNGLSIIADGTLSLVQATNSLLGGVKVDANTIVINASTGVISSVQTQADWNNTDNSSRAYIQNKPTILNSKWGNTFENIWYTSGNVGIGTATNTTGVKLDVNGIIESRTSIGANSSFYFRGVANSDLSRVTIAGQLSTGSAVNDTILRSTNKLVLQSGTASPAIVINTNNNVGIGTTNPNANLHLHGNGASQNVRISFSDNTSGIATTDGFCIGKDTAQVGYIYNNENNAISIGTNNTERMRIYAGGAIGLQSTGYGIPNNFMNGGSLAIGNTGANYGGGTGSWNANTEGTAGLLMECADNTEIAIHDNATALHSFMRYTTNGNFTIGRDMGHGTANVNIAGTLSVPVDRGHNSSDGKARYYYINNGPDRKSTRLNSSH